MFYSILGIIIVNFTLYWRTIFYGLTCDDTAIFNRKAPKVGVLKQILYEVRGMYIYRRKKGELEDAGNPRLERIHIITLSLHTLVCVGIYLIFGRDMFSLAVAFIFSVHPVNNQVSMWISGKGYAISALLALGIYSFPMVAPLFWLVGYYWGASNIYLFPLILLGTKYWYWVLLIPFLIQHPSRSLINKPGSNKVTRTISWDKIILVIKTFGYYFRLAIIAKPLCLHHNLLTALGLHKEYDKKAYALDKDFYLGLAICYFVITNIIFNPENSFGLWWFSVCIIQYCNFITISTYIGERYLYLANIGICYSLSKMCFVAPYPYGLCLFTFIFSVYATRTFDFMPAYKNETWNIQMNLVEQWDNFRARRFQARQKFRQGEYIGALCDFNIAYMTFKHDFKTCYDLAITCIALGDLETATEMIKKARRNVYQSNQKEEALKMVGEIEKAIEEAKLTGQIQMNKMQVLE